MTAPTPVAERRIWALPPPVVVVFDEFGDLLVELVDHVVEIPDELFDGVFNVLGQGLGQAGLLDGAALDELPAAGDQFVQEQTVFRGALAQVRAAGLAEVGQELCVEAVVLGEAVLRLGVVAGLAGIDQGDGEAGVHEINGGTGARTRRCAR